jgi:hypothetical protein
MDEDQTSSAEKELQQRKFKEISTLLLNAGYFRVTITTLSEFDKVVGGLCWCIISSGEAVDVDILFQENATIGQRIALSEAIVVALRQMKCPCLLEPHQIQGGVGGSDFNHIEPVIAWLVKKFSKRRNLIEWQLRTFSTLQYSKDFTPLGGTTQESSALDEIFNRAKVTRKFKRKAPQNESEETRVHSCLLEYGDGQHIDDKDGRKIIRVSMHDDADVSLEGLNASELTLFERKLARAQRDAQADEERFAAAESEEEKVLMAQMKGLSGEEDSAVSGSSVGAIVGLGASEIGSASAAYDAQIEEAARKLDAANFAQGSKRALEAAHRKRKQKLEKLRELNAVKIDELQKAVDASAVRLHLAEEEFQSTNNYIAKLKQQSAKWDDWAESSDQMPIINALRKYLLQNNRLKQQEQLFKGSCKTQLTELEESIRALELKNDSKEDSEEDKKCEEIENMHRKITAKYAAMKEGLGSASLDIANTVRRIDQVFL